MSPGAGNTFLAVFYVCMAILDGQARPLVPMLAFVVGKKCD
jgi:hypothetical protein